MRQCVCVETEDTARHPWYDPGADLAAQGGMLDAHRSGIGAAVRSTTVCVAASGGTGGAGLTVVMQVARAWGP